MILYFDNIPWHIPNDAMGLLYIKSKTNCLKFAKNNYNNTCICHYFNIFY